LQAKWIVDSRNSPDMHLISLFNRIIDRYPDHTALRYENEFFTYNQLNNSSNALMERLHGMGIQPGTRVGLYCTDPVLFIHAMLALVKLNAIYVPFDKKDTLHNIADLCALAEIKFFLHDQPHPLTELNPFNPVYLCRHDLQTANKPGALIAVDAQSNPVLYIMFTSSTTGKAKGVLIQHAGISRFFVNPALIKIEPGDCLLQGASIAFDGSSYEIWAALLNGATLVLVNQEFDFLNLGAFLVQYQINVLWLTTKLFETILQINPAVFENLKYIIFGGETCNFSLIISAFNNLAPGKLIHAYGPTENTIFTTLHLVNKEDEKRGFIPIGFPVQDTACFILDKHLQEVPEGNIGVLYVSGAGVAQGYTDAQVTEKCFILHPTLGVRMYNTKDLVRYSPVYGYEFIGRKDRQVKWNGYRIELDLIENTTHKITNIVHAAAVYLPSRYSDELTLFYTTKDKQPISLSLIKDFLEQHLPWYSIPKNIQFLVDFPLNKSNKVDQKKLIELIKSHHKQLQNANASVESIWKEVLQLETVTDEDHFFNRGGDSLSSIVVVSKTNQLLNLNLKTSYIIENPVFKDFVANLLKKKAGQKEIVVLKEGAADCPICLIPGLGGGSEMYYSLANNLQTKQSIYGFNMQLDFDYELGNYYIITYKLILRLSKLFASIICQSVASKKVILAGYSLGGNIALEMIPELEKNGIEVAQVHLLDSYKFGHTVLNTVGELRFSYAFFRKCVAYLNYAIAYRDLKTCKQLINFIYQPEINTRKISHTPVFLYRCSNFENEPFKAVNTWTHDWENTIEQLTIMTINGEHNYLLKEGYVEKLVNELDRSIDSLLNELDLQVKKFEVLPPELLDAYLARGWFRLKFGNHLFTHTKAAFENNIYEIKWVRYKLDETFLKKTLKRIQSNKLKRKRKFRYLTSDFDYTKEKEALEALYRKYRSSLSFEGHASVFSMVHPGESDNSVFKSKLIKLYDNDILIGAALVDTGAIAAAEILSFYDPDYSKFGLGIYLRLLFLEYLVSQNFQYYYPGFVFIGHPKMDNKLRVAISGLEYYDAQSDKWIAWEKGAAD